MSKRICTLFIFFYTVFSVLCLVLISSHITRENLLSIDFLLGPVSQDYTPLEIVWWLFLFTPVWGACGWILDISTRISPLEIYRYKKSIKWWIKLEIKIYAVNLWYFFIFYIILTAKSMVLMDLRIIMGLMVHSGAMVTTMLLIYLWSGKINIAFIIAIILEALAKLPIIAGISPKINPLVWGMYGYCEEIYGYHGFKFLWAIAIQISYILVIIIVPMRLKNLILRGIRFEKK